MTRYSGPDERPHDFTGYFVNVRARRGLAGCRTGDGPADRPADDRAGARRAAHGSAYGKYAA